ncbi:MAG: 4Fe-4S dicluster domain-containing protein [Chloroflexi bacterium]|nr:4Fe-4S dicluster domain-containing protein [Chloroflexota bacterium]
MPQYGFYFDQTRCTGCHACSVICKTWNDIGPGPVKWMRVFQWEQGVFPKIGLNILAVPCFHCETPVCVNACSAGALIKEDKYGAVLVDTEKCQEAHSQTDCRRCWKACPYGAPQFESNDPRATMSKCTMCIDRLEEGLKPICVLSCSLRALEFDTMENLERKFGNRRTLDGLPNPDIARPAAIFKPRQGKRQLIPYDPEKALDLWQQRGPFAAPDLPPVFNSKSDVTDLSPQLVGRDRIELHPRSVDELMYYTIDDE